MNTVLCVGLLVCVCMAYASALPAEVAQPVETLQVQAEPVEQELLQPEETFYRGHGRRYGGWGHRGWGGGYGHGGGWGHGYGRGYGGGGYGYGGGWGGGYGGGWGGGYGWGR